MPALVRGYNIGSTNYFFYFEEMNDLQEDIFTVSLNPIAATHLKKSYSTAKWLFRIGIFNCALRVICEFTGAAFYDIEKLRDHFPLYWQMKLNPWLMLLYSIFFITQLVFYLRFVRKIDSALNGLDNETFNESFSLLNRFNQWALWGTILNVFFVLLEAWVTYDMTFGRTK
jgi:hypothetical protein